MLERFFSFGSKKAEKPAEPEPSATEKAKKIIHTAETARTAEGKKISLREAVAELTKLIDSIDISTKPDFDEVTALLQAVRIKAGLLMKLSGWTPWEAETLKCLEETKKVLDQWQRNEKLLLWSKDHSTDLDGKPYCFEIELQRDTAQFFQKLGDLTGQAKYYELAAYLLEKAVKSVEPKNQNDPAVALALFEQQVNLDLAGQTIDFNLLKELHQKVEAAYPDNWDRRAAVSWWLYECGRRHKNQELETIGITHCKTAITSGGEQSWLAYKGKRMGANWASRLQRAQFKTFHGRTDEAADKYLKGRGLTKDVRLTAVNERKEGT